MRKRPDIIEIAKNYILRCEQEKTAGRVNEWSEGPVDLIKDLVEEIEKNRRELR